MPTLRCSRRSEQGFGERRLMLLPGLSTAVAVVVLDQLGKATVRGYFAGQAASEQENVTSFFNIVLTYWLSRVESPLLAVAIGLVIGGAIGNVIDRICFGAVVDFLDFHVGSWHWPAFNVADSAICVGVAVMLLDGLLLRREAH